jgi:hypothetical protein
MTLNSAVVTIFSHTEELIPSEIMSLRQCVSVLGQHMIRLIVPEGLNHAAYLRVAPKLEIKPLPAVHFESLESYNKLKLSQVLYRDFADCEYLLTYELDSFVFRDELSHWAGQNWDYVGAPWFEGFADAVDHSPVLGVGNSGFSLRKISRCKLVIARVERLKYLRKLIGIGGLTYGQHAFDRIIQKVFGKVASKVTAGFHVPEDFFWAWAAPRLCKGFNIAPYEVARQFSFEVNPTRLYREIGRLPFGCHAWEKYDPEFWRSHIS